MSTTRARSGSAGASGSGGVRGRSNSGGINRATTYTGRSDSFLDAEMRASAMTTSVFNSNDFKASKEPRRYTEEEKERMQAYESVDTFEPQTLLYKDHLSRREKEPRGFIWFYVVVIGFLSGLVAITIVSLLHLCFALKMKLLAIGLNGFSSSTDGDNSSFGQGRDPSLVGMTSHSYIGGYFLWVLFSVGCTAITSLIAYFIPECVGVGTPEVTAYLNGIENTGMYKPQVLFAKVACAVLNVASGLPVGHLGAVIQSGSMIASMLVSRSHFARFRKLPIVSVFRNPRDRRIFTVVGAAAGVASAFSVAVGALLFVMEQLSTVFPVRFAVYVFVSCLVAVFSIQSYFSFFAYFSARDRGGLQAGELLSDVLIQFDTKIRDVAPVSMNVFDFIPTVLIGFLCGVLCAMFIRLNWISLRIRRHLQKKFTKLRYFEPIIIVFLYTTIMYWITVSFGSEMSPTTDGDACKPVPQVFLANRNSSIVSYYGLNGVMCNRDSQGVHIDGRVTEVNTQVYQPFGSLSMGFPDSTLQLLMSWRVPDAFSAQALIIFFIFYFIFAAVTSGIQLSGDFLLPLLVIGATIGRLVGLLVKAAAGSLPGSSMWADPGVFALVGAAAFLGGATGLTFSICIIMIEITNDFRHVLCVMLAISISKKVSEMLAHSIGVSYLEAQCVPLLDFAQQVEKYDMFCAKHVMAAPVICLHNVDTVKSVIDLTASNTHSGFPVLSIADGTHQGIVHKKQLYQVLWHIYLTNSVEAASYEQLRYIEDEGYLERDADDWIPPFSDEVLEWRIDLNPYIDTAAYCVHESTAMSRTYNMFRTLGLRQLVVITRENTVAGIITRKDLLADNIMDRIMEENRRRARAKKAARRANSMLAEQGGGGGGGNGNSAATPGGRTKVTEWLVAQDSDEEDPQSSPSINSNVQSFELNKQRGRMHPASNSNLHDIAPGDIVNSRLRAGTATTASDAREPEGGDSSHSSRPSKGKKSSSTSANSRRRGSADEVPNLPGKQGDPAAREAIQSILRYTDGQMEMSNNSISDTDEGAESPRDYSPDSGQRGRSSSTMSPGGNGLRGTRNSNVSFATDIVEVGSAYSPTSPQGKDFPQTPPAQASFREKGEDDGTA